MAHVTYGIILYETLINFLYVTIIGLAMVRNVVLMNTGNKYVQLYLTKVKMTKHFDMYNQKIFKSNVLVIKTILYYDQIY